MDAPHIVDLARDNPFVVVLGILGTLVQLASIVVGYRVHLAQGAARDERKRQAVFNRYILDKLEAAGIIREQPAPPANGS